MSLFVFFIHVNTSSLSFFISIVRSSQCFVYCHFAVFSLSTTFLINYYQLNLKIRNLSQKIIFIPVVSEDASAQALLFVTEPC